MFKLKTIQTLEIMKCLLSPSTYVTQHEKIGLTVNLWISNLNNYTIYAAFHRAAYRSLNSKGIHTVI